MQERKTGLSHGNEPWVKKSGNKGFHISMGWFNGGKVSEIVGTYILNKISNEIKITLDFTVFLEMYLGLKWIEQKQSYQNISMIWSIYSK